MIQLITPVVMLSTHRENIWPLSLAWFDVLIISWISNHLKLSLDCDRPNMTFNVLILEKELLAPNLVMKMIEQEIFACMTRMASRDMDEWSYAIYLYRCNRCKY